MISQLKGVLLVKAPPEIVLDVHGVGYELQVPMSTLYQLPELEESCCLFTHLIVREDAHQLYGFASIDERQLFRDLLKVNAVGPKLALAILSTVSVNEFVTVIRQHDSAALVAVPGVGKKTAERLIIEMIDRVKNYSHSTSMVSDGAVSSSSLAQVERNHDYVPHIINQATNALITLGYKLPEAKKAVQSVNAEEKDSLEGLIRAALKYLAKV